MSILGHPVFVVPLSAHLCSVVHAHINITHPADHVCLSFFSLSFSILHTFLLFDAHVSFTTPHKLRTVCPSLGDITSLFLGHLGYGSYQKYIYVGTI
uniref:Uncharacterized protein n=1 Tax=Octopus bimaculoides TaxID=37653 RepID=A0A0L8I040_OCTBM